MLSTSKLKQLVTLSDSFHIGLLFVINSFIKRRSITKSCRYLKLSTIKRACFKTILAMAYKKFKSQTPASNLWTPTVTERVAIGVNQRAWGQVTQEMKKWKFNDHKRHRFRIFLCIGFVLQWIHWNPDPKDLLNWCHCHCEQWRNVYTFYWYHAFHKGKPNFNKTFKAR